jgi:hypothetical protein
VLFPSFDFNIIEDVRCCVSVFYGRWFSSVFLAVPVLVLPKGSVARSFFASDFVRRATPSCAQVSAFSSRNFDLSSSAASVCRSLSYLGAPTGTAGQGLTRVPSIRSSLGSARSLSDHVGALSDRHLAQSDLCPIVTWLSQISVQSCRVSV